jgi:hypothetical protein
MTFTVASKNKNQQKATEQTDMVAIVYDMQKNTEIKVQLQNNIAP